MLGAVGNERQLPQRTELTAAERTIRARMAAYAMHATHDARETTEPARRAFLARFEQQVDPTLSLPEAERMRRAEAAKTASFIGLALRSAKVRRQRSKERSGGGPAA